MQNIETQQSKPSQPWICSRNSGHAFAPLVCSAQPVIDGVNSTCLLWGFWVDAQLLLVSIGHVGVHWFCFRNITYIGMEYSVHCMMSRQWQNAQVSGLRALSVHAFHCFPRFWTLHLHPWSRRRRWGYFSLQCVRCISEYAEAAKWRRNVVTDLCYEKIGLLCEN